MRDIPLDVILSWALPNYTDLYTRGIALVIMNGAFISLVLVVVTLRIYTRIVIMRWFGSDDVFIAFALILICSIYGWNRYARDITLNVVPNTGKIYCRLAQDSDIAWFRWAIHFSFGYTIATCITFIALTVFLCTPALAYWVLLQLPNSKCLPEDVVILAAGSINCFADLVVTVLPMPIVARLQMPKQQRVDIIALFSLGFVVTITEIVRKDFI
ncbi:hypothetical protein K432DRAFT_431768 [Lepidopterella palustris CBS 459.81]|uniref:Rhodopsin domain-containing protein n=1 Tax=Lepidopterella palustris CBS 459.81 TaxID=1314670 RepID=A0A8E2EJU1_9PEZI|nr:hypothetical protein K432DRAFT_431768 [Lepidopterella palustris CBS 459.81]